MVLVEAGFGLVVTTIVVDGFVSVGDVLPVFPAVVVTPADVVGLVANVLVTGVWVLTSDTVVDLVVVGLGVIISLVVVVGAVVVVVVTA